MQLNGFNYKRKLLNISLWPIEGTLTGTTSTSQSGLGTSLHTKCTIVTSPWEKWRTHKNLPWITNTKVYSLLHFLSSRWGERNSSKTESNAMRRERKRAVADLQLSSTFSLVVLTYAFSHGLSSTLCVRPPTALYIVVSCSQLSSLPRRVWQSTDSFPVPYLAPSLYSFPVLVSSSQSELVVHLLRIRFYFLPRASLIILHWG